jgi:RimJ/RimL family protein N-acetyltransferase
MMAQALGPVVAGWQAPHVPGSDPMAGRFVTLERLRPDHAPALWAAIAGRDDLWAYMAAGPFADESAFAVWVGQAARQADPQFWAICPDGGACRGVASYLRITPDQGVIEVGNILFSPALQGTPAATEAMALMMGRAFGLGFRRYEWKCNALNTPSRQAARRLGFGYEGVFRQHMIIKGHNRDTAWFAITDGDWPAVQAALDRWLDPGNFDAAGRQRVALSGLTAGLGAPDPGL